MKTNKVLTMFIKIVLFNLLLTSCISLSRNNESTVTGNDLDNVNFDYTNYKKDSIILK
jgi:ABC-type maltose transport system permease subunit